MADMDSRQTMPTPSGRTPRPVEPNSIRFLWFLATPADRLLLGFLGSLTVLILIRPRYTLLTWWQPVLVNVILSVIIFYLISVTKNTRSRFLQWLHDFYPIILIGWLYPLTCSLRYTFFKHSFDSWLNQWELWLFHNEGYRVIPARLAPGWMELFHGIYFSYYVGIILFAWLAYRSQPEQVRRYVFSLLLANVVIGWILILFPTEGPVSLRPNIVPDGAVFIPIMNWIYQNLDMGGGAFPSLHAAAAVVMTLYNNTFFPRWRWLFLLYLLLILAAAVICSFHYVVDIFAGAFIGILLTVCSPWFFNKLSLKNPN